MERDCLDRAENPQPHGQRPQLPERAGVHFDQRLHRRRELQNTSDTYVTLAEKWNGTAWTVQKTPNPVGAYYSTLSGVACTSTSACTAVGYYMNGSDAQGHPGRSMERLHLDLAENARRQQTTTSALSGVACTSTSACTAVGVDYNTSAADEFTLAEKWNGTTWTCRQPRTPRAPPSAPCRAWRAPRPAHAPPSGSTTTPRTTSSSPWLRRGTAPPGRCRKPRTPRLYLQRPDRRGVSIDQRMHRRRGVREQLGNRLVHPGRSVERYGLGVIRNWSLGYDKPRRSESEAR